MHFIVIGPNPMHIYSELSTTVAKGAYSQVSGYRSEVGQLGVHMHCCHYHPK